MTTNLTTYNIYADAITRASMPLARQGFVRRGVLGNFIALAARCAR